MRRSLLCVSFLCCLLTANAQALKASADSTSRYAMDIRFRDAQLTGICLLRDTGEQVVGSAINEFGIKAFDFVLDKRKGKVRLMDVVPFLDKWYTKRVLRADLGVLLRARNTPRQLRKRDLRATGQQATLENTKYRLTYTFKSLYDTER